MDFRRFRKKKVNCNRLKQIILLCFALIVSYSLWMFTNTVNNNNKEIKKKVDTIQNHGSSEKKEKKETLIVKKSPFPSSIPPKKSVVDETNGKKTENEESIKRQIEVSVNAKHFPIETAIVLVNGKAVDKEKYKNVYDYVTFTLSYAKKYKDQADTIDIKDSAGRNICKFYIQGETKIDISKKCPQN